MQTTKIVPYPIYDWSGAGMAILPDELPVCATRGSAQLPYLQLPVLFFVSSVHTHGGD